MAPFHYQEIDTNALKALEAGTRKRILKRIHQAPSHVTQTYDQVRSNFSSYPIADLFAYEYHYSGRYMSQDDVKDNTHPNDANSMRPFTNRSHNAYVFMSVITMKPIVELYSTFANRISDIFDELISSERTSEQVEGAIRRVISVHIEYANEVSDFFDDKNLGESTNIHTDISMYIWNIEEDHDDQNSALGPLNSINFDELDQASNRLESLLRDNDLPTELLQLILSPTLGSHGTSLITQTCNPVLVKILPVRQSVNLGRAIIDATYTDEDGDGISYLKIQEDKTLQYLETLAQQAFESAEADDIKDKILRWSVGLDQQDRGRGSNTPSAFQNAFGEPAGGKNKGKKTKKDDTDKEESSKEQKRDKGKSNDDDPDPSGSGTGSSTEPDDSGYTPNANLSRLAANYISSHAQLPRTDMSHDHMTRFGITNEGPQGLPSRDIQQGDYRFYTNDRYGRHGYLVTFTRKSRKPIFNAIQ